MRLYDEYDAMTNTIKTLSIEGFKSIRLLKDFELSPLNVLLGGSLATPRRLRKACTNRS